MKALMPFTMVNVIQRALLAKGQGVRDRKDVATYSIPSRIPRCVGVKIENRRFF